ncbi:hypothetical protein [uncultured Cocleimonas sp.]|uniref:hypothetical protein n=1 Tax=uncultured Cocleimonas sp. TaxID=1051587 RepID=UPI00261338C8|nr:hypothetical protein [uncultured Cocleimonas sp.]
MIAKKIVLITLFVGLGILGYKWYSDCMKDHSKVIKEISKPMQKNVLAFYEEHQRYPTLEESAELMEKAGCMNTRQVKYGETKTERGKIYERWASFDCSHGFFKIGYYFEISIGDQNAGIYTNPYRIHSNKGNTRCFSNFDKSGKLRSKFHCYQDSCFFKNLSH